jgi:hypothetical protein
MEFLWRYLLLIWYHKLLRIANIQLVHLLFIVPLVLPLIKNKSSCITATIGMMLPCNMTI